MLSLGGYPKNKAHFQKLIPFVDEFITVCKPLKIDFLLSGSLAVFLHCQSPDLIIHDVDLACPESRFPFIEKILNESYFRVNLRTYHVLQVYHDDLKIDLDSLGYWYHDIPLKTELCNIQHHQIGVLALESLAAFYAKGVAAKAGRLEELEKYHALKAKQDILVALMDRRV